jgi:hypothetical protein
MPAATVLAGAGRRSHTHEYPKLGVSVLLLGNKIGAVPAGPHANSPACSQRIKDIEAGKVLFVVGYSDALVRFGDGGDNHI